MTNNIIQFRPKTYIKPEDRQANIEAIHSGIEDEAARIADIIDNKYVQAMVDLTFNRPQRFNPDF